MQEIKRLLKPGQLFGGYEWIITDKYDENDPEHVKIKKGIEVGNGLPDLEKPSHIVDSLKKAGFEVLEVRVPITKIILIRPVFITHIPLEKKPLLRGLYCQILRD